jgi:hypothetical protein
MSKLKVDTETGELLTAVEMIESSKAPAIIIDISEIAVYHKTPLELAKKIENQAGFMVFDVKSKSGRDACRSHAANIIKCISPALNESKRLADDAKKVINQDLYFRKTFETRVREIADYHRKPLTEWEEEQKRIEEKRLSEEQRIKDAAQYQSDWQDAIDFDELYTIRKAKQLEAERLEAERLETLRKEQLELEVQARIERERALIQRQEEEKAQAKLRQEQAIIEREYKENIVYEQSKIADKKIIFGEIETERRPSRRAVILQISQRFNMILKDAESHLIETFRNG